MSCGSWADEDESEEAMFGKDRESTHPVDKEDKTKYEQRERTCAWQLQARGRGVPVGPGWSLHLNDNIETYPPGDLLHNFNTPVFMPTVFVLFYSDISET